MGLDCSEGCFDDPGANYNPTKLDPYWGSVCYDDSASPAYDCDEATDLTSFYSLCACE